MTTDRNPIYIQLINSYLSQLTEDDLYKLHDIVRNTVTSRLEPSAKDSVDEEPPRMGVNQMIYSDTLVLPADSKRSTELLIRFENEIDVLRHEIGHLKFYTAPYGVLWFAWENTGLNGSGVVVFFGINGVLDGLVSINGNSRTVHTSAIDRRTGDARSFTETHPLNRDDLCKGLQSLAKKYQVVLNKQKS
jgi:hypothetical protein